MSSTTRNYKVRLAAVGQKQFDADLRALGASGEKSLRRIQSATAPASAGLRETDLAARQLRGGISAVSAELPALKRLAMFMGGTALVGGLVAFGRGSLDVGRQFQAMMQRVEAATGAGEADVSRLGEAAKRLGETTAFSAMQAAEAIEVLAKNGVSVSDTLGGALDSSVMLASALGAEVAPSADLVTDVMQQFGLTAAQLPEIVDRLTGAAFTSKFGFDDLRLAIAQAGGVAGTTGVEIEDFLTVLSATASSFASGSDAGTSFKTFLQRLTPESAKAAGVMQDLGLEFFDAQGNMKDMADIAQELQDGLAGLSEEARNDALKTVFGTDAIRTAAALASQGATGLRDLAAAMGEVSAQEQAEVRMRGLDGALKEVAAAWEALQLESAQNGGLDVAETFVRRLTDALRYLTENFSEVEEIAERVGQALTVYLVGKGMTLAIAKGVAMRAAMIELAASVTATGTAAGRAVGPLTRMGVAARVLTGVMGGPLSLAITAASLLAFGLDTDVAADAVERADAAAMKAADALDAYQEASKRAADEQKGLGGAVSAATQAMLDQSRAALEQARTDLERALANARDKMSGSVLDGDGIDDFIQRFDMFRDAVSGDSPGLLSGLRGAAQNKFMKSLVEIAEGFRQGEVSATDFASSMDALRAVGPALDSVRDGIVGILESGEDLSGNGKLSPLVAAAEQAGLFRDEIEAVRRATTEADLAAAYDNLAHALTEAAEAGKLLRSDGLSDFRENIAGLAGVEERLADVKARLDGALDTTREISAERPFDETADSAKDAADEIDRLQRVYGQYQASRAHSDQVTFASGASDAAKKGLRDLIGYAEGTDKGRGYNETLGYGAFTGGDVNLVSMTLDEILALQKQMLAHPDNSYNSSAVGRYQIVSTTLRSLMREMGLSGGELFSSGLQDQMADRLIDRRGRDTGPLRQEWQGLNRVDDATILGAFDQGAGSRAESASDRVSTLQQLIAVGDEHLAQLRLEASLAGKSVEEQARLTFQYEALQRAKEQGIDVDKTLVQDGRTLRQVIDDQASALGRLAAADEAQQALKDRLQQTEDSIRGLFDNLKPGGAGEEAFWDQLTSMIIDKLWSLATDPVWEALATAFDGLGQGAGGAGAGSWVGSLVSGIFGGTPERAGGGGFRNIGRGAGLLDGVGGKRQDNLIAKVSRGEFVQPASAVDFYGAGFMEAVRNRRIPKFADGGMVGVASTAPMGSSSQRGDVEIKGGELTLSDDGSIMARVRFEQAQGLQATSRATSRNFAKRAAQQRERGI
ncbi:TP901 family phage tail tape measure protein [Salipiger aestuarii]|uniref:TP901 family phage tail tape measure protein n=1 Tax=Salipiger aestuarii TaxID=568098 RepID=A0A327YU80_9RHOB|nr:phage tail tape measure protein [Salipiger aestuarii]RAK24111.1 TP901 family phage tail tape measure protein [Salipiger aestuarii]